MAWERRVTTVGSEPPCTSFSPAARPAVRSEPLGFAVPSWQGQRGRPVLATVLLIRLCAVAVFRVGRTKAPNQFWRQITDPTQDLSGVPWQFHTLGAQGLSLQSWLQAWDALGCVCRRVREQHKIRGVSAGLFRIVSRRDGTVWFVAFTWVSR